MVKMQLNLSITFLIYFFIHKQTTMEIFLIYISEGEGTALCDILTNNYNSWQMRMSGEILLNGVSVAPARLQVGIQITR